MLAYCLHNGCANSTTSSANIAGQLHRGQGNAFTLLEISWPDSWESLKHPPKVLKSLRRGKRLPRRFLSPVLPWPMVGGGLWGPDQADQPPAVASLFCRKKENSPAGLEMVE